MQQRRIAWGGGRWVNIRKQLRLPETTQLLDARVETYEDGDVQLRLLFSSPDFPETPEGEEVKHVSALYSWVDPEPDQLVLRFKQWK